MSGEGENYENFKAGFWISLFGHCACVAFIFLAAVFNYFFEDEKKEPEPFTLMPPPSVLPQAPKPTQPKVIQPLPPEQIKVEKIKPLDEIKLPPEPKPVKLPELPKPNPKPKPKPTAKDSNNAKQIKPKVSAEDFFKKRPRPQPKPRNRQQTKGVKINQVKTDLSSKIQAVNTSDFSSEVSNTEMSNYQSEVLALIHQNWIMPEECAGLVLVVRVRFTINANGKVSNFKILRSSGEVIFDKSVEKVLKILTFRSPPRGKSLTLNINFNSDTVD